MNLVAVREQSKDFHIGQARWIDHNGGGFTWDGLCGRPCQWRSPMA